MENKVEMKLEDYDSLRINEIKLNNIENSIKKYSEGVNAIRAFNFSQIAKIEINKNEFLEALGYDKEVEIIIIK